MASQIISTGRSHSFLVRRLADEKARDTVGDERRALWQGTL